MSVISGSKTTFGKQVRGNWRSSPEYGFGSCTRDMQDKVFVSSEHARLVGGGVESPGVGAYSHHPSVGKQVDGAKASSPLFSFGTGAQYMANSKDNAPGPGAYNQDDAVGAQVSSQRKSAPTVGFGSATRTHRSSPIARATARAPVALLYAPVRRPPCAAPPACKRSPFRTLYGYIAV